MNGPKHILWLQSLYLYKKGAILHPLCTYPRYEPCSLAYATFFLDNYPIGVQPHARQSVKSGLEQQMSQFNAIVQDADAMQLWTEGVIPCHNAPYDLRKDRYLV